MTYRRGIVRLSPLPAILLLGGAALLGGCGSASKPASPPAVQLSLTAPVDGATVAVRNIDVLGTIRPNNAVVVVAGKRVRVVNGAFKQPLLLRRPLTRISVVVNASGYVGSTSWVTVHYVPAPAPASGSAGDTASIATMAPAGKGASVPAPSPRDSELGAGFITGCTRAGGSIAGCQCVWSQLVKRGFDTAAQWKAALESWRRSFLSNGTISYGPAFRDAILACVATLRHG
jgi:hypothetical protein